MKRYILLFLLSCFFSFFQTEAKAQCTSDAGTLPLGDTTTCRGITIPVDLNLDESSGFFLDSNDVLQYIFFTDLNDPLNSVFNKSAFPWIPVDLATVGHFYYAAIVGDSLTNGDVNFLDPCLSISNSFEINISGTIGVKSAQIIPCSDTVKFIFEGELPLDVKIINGTETTEVTLDTTVFFLSLLPSMDFSLVVEIIDAEGCFSQSVHNFNTIPFAISKAGTLPPDSIVTCEASIKLPIPQSLNLDSNDVMWYMVFTNENDPFGSRRSLHRGILPDSTTISLFNLQSPIYVVALVGDSLSTGEIDLNDPCLSMSNPLKIYPNNVWIDFFGPICFDEPGQVYMTGQPPFTIRIIEPSNDTIITEVVNGNSYDFDFGLFGTFTIDATSATGCVARQQVDIFPEPPIEIDAVVTNPLSCLTPITDIVLTVIGGLPPYTFNISNGVVSTSPVIPISDPGTYTIFVTDAMGCFSTINVTVPFENLDCGYITGEVKLDNDMDCDFTTPDTPLDCWLVVARGSVDTFYATTNQLGEYQIGVLPDTYQVDVVPISPLYSSCSSSQTVMIANPNDFGNADFLMQADILCPFMEVDIGISRLRRCFDNNTIYVQYCNQGTVTALDASVKIKLDPMMFPSNSALPFTQSGDTVIFEIGDVAPLECDNFIFQVQVSCNAVLGQTLCAEARISPDSLCTSPSPLWSQASLKLSAKCIGDSVVFNVKNVGTGTMNMDRQYIIIEDAAIMRVSPTFQLPPGDSIRDAVFPTGATVRVEVPQVDNHPGNSMPSIAVEGCGASNFSIGFVNQLPTDDADPWVDIECAEVQGSYDPNDKAAVPTGFESAHFIEQNVDLEYKIRFQNTGNDTAFTVVILDTLSHLLNIESLSPGASSHDYSWEVFEDGILKFTFDNILLVDSFTNEPASNGFVKYRISQMPDVALGSVIKNTADIYFDFNDPIHTNQTFHTVGKDFISVSTQEVFVPGAEVRVYPNPFKTEAQFEVLNAPRGEKTLRIFNLSGKLIRSQVFENEQLTLKRNVLLDGIYFYEISGEGAKIAVGKLIVQ